MILSLPRFSTLEVATSSSKAKSISLEETQRIMKTNLTGAKLKASDQKIRKKRT